MKKYCGKAAIVGIATITLILIPLLVGASPSQTQVFEAMSYLSSFQGDTDQTPPDPPDPPNPWDWNTDLTPPSSIASRGGASMDDIGSPGGGGTDASDVDIHLSDTIADAVAQPLGTVIQLCSKPISSVDSAGALTLAEDETSDTLQVAYANAGTAADPTYRVSAVIGTLDTDGTNPVLDVDSGPNYSAQESYAGNLQMVYPGTIAMAKTYPDGTEMTLGDTTTGKIVSRAWTDYFYIEEDNRMCGIEVEMTGHGLVVGDRAYVVGTIETDPTTNERYIAGTTVSPAGSGQVNPLGMPNKMLGGGNFAYVAGPPIQGQQGVAGASGLNNIGILVKAWGTVTSVGSGYFYLDDGSNCSDGSGVSGVRVLGVTNYMPGLGDYLTVTGISGLATYATNPARTIRLALQSDLCSVSPPLPPANLTATSTGSGKITLYWDASGGTGYNIYRGTASGGENYSAPVNGGTPANTLSYSGGSVYMFTDTGLTDGTEYFYTVKAVGGGKESQASNESSDIPDPNAIPWTSSNPSDVLSAVRSQYANDPPQGSLRVAGPDGQIYEDGQSSVLPPDGIPIAGTNQMAMSDGTTSCLPDYPDPSNGFSIMSVSDIEPLLAASVLPQHLGPYRRVKTTGSYTGVRGDVYVPVAGNVFVNRNATYADGQSTTDDIYILLGSTGTGEVDAGLQWSQVGSTKNGWNPFMLSYPRQKPIINRPSSPRFLFDEFLNLTYRARTTYSGIKRSVSLITINSDDQGVTRSYGVYSVYKANENVRVKRMHSIAQARAGAFRSSSIIQGVSWSSGQVRTSSGSWTGWTNAITNENGSNPAKGGIVNWFETSPYVAEDSISINLR